ncbi:MAG: dynein gamma chain protein [Coriobacteriia bacterium]|nr:dynein gamma chain protein [Coriobacteriia bacterium]
MCTNGVNSAQFKASIEQIDEAVALTRRWTHRCFHTADNAQLSKTAAQLQAAQGLLDEVRALLSEASDLAEEEEASAANVSVSLV